MDAVNNSLKNLHLFWRTGFGPSLQQLRSLGDISPETLVNNILKAPGAPPAPINVASEQLQSLYTKYQDPELRKSMTGEDRKNLMHMQRVAINKLNTTWFNEIVSSEDQLREKMAFFWHGHFACRNTNLFYNQLLLDAIRKNALGNFRELLSEVSHSAAMLYFLNNQQNKKDNPNENFAREVKELFTLGRGNYTERDIKEAARAFTGWTADNKGNFIFRKRQHDEGVKTVLGKSGNLNGDDVLNILLSQKQTAKYITGKLYRFLVNENVDEKIVSSLAESFYASDYDIKKLIATILLSDWFYNSKNIGAKIKSPVELLAGIRRAVPMQVKNDNDMVNLQKILGQQLFYPPNVAGWPGGKNWIDNSTLMMRLRIPQMFYDKDYLNVEPKQDDDQLMGRKSDGAEAVPDKPKKPQGYKLINAQIDWPAYTAIYKDTSREALTASISAHLLLVPIRDENALLKNNVDAGSREGFITTTTIQLMSTPEYQLC